jgi:hypothetical protein
MRELRRRDVPERRYTYFWHLLLAFLGYDETNGVARCDTLRAAGIKVRRGPGPVKFGSAIIALIEEPGRIQDRTDPTRAS